MSAGPTIATNADSRSRLSSAHRGRVRDLMSLCELPAARELLICLAVVVACLSAVALGAGIVVIRALWSAQF